MSVNLKVSIAKGTIPSMDGYESIRCSICLLKFQEGDRVLGHNAVQNYGMHVFDRDCLTKWLKDHRTCPSCRISFNLDVPRSDLKNWNFTLISEASFPSPVSTPSESQEEIVSQGGADLHRLARNRASFPNLIELEDNLEQFELRAASAPSMRELEIMKYTEQADRILSRKNSKKR